MARLSEPRITLKLAEPFRGFFAGMTSIERENALRAALKEWLSGRMCGM